MSILVIKPGGCCPTAQVCDEPDSPAPPAVRDSSPTACVGAISVPSGDGAHASPTVPGRGRFPVLGGGACVTYLPRPNHLLPLPLPPGVGLCLVCMWADSRADEAAVGLHTRCTGHPTIYRPYEPEQGGDGGR